MSGVLSFWRRGGSHRGRSTGTLPLMLKKRFVRLQAWVGICNFFKMLEKPTPLTMKINTSLTPKKKLDIGHSAQQWEPIEAII
jgi:hypothetical protein